VPPTVTPLLPAHLRIDDPTIPNTLTVWRTLDPREAPVDPTTGQREIMSSVFRCEEVSVHMSDHVSQTDVVRKNPGAYLAEFTVGDARRENCRVRRDPNDAAHGLIYDDQKPGDRPLTRGQVRRIRDSAKLIIP
jgi:hypothetical protein